MFASIRPAATLIALALTGTAAALAAPAGAAMTDADTRSVTVRVADLDLASAKGTAALDTRVRHAVNAVCGGGDGRDLAVRSQIVACRQIAMTRAAPQIELAIAGARSADRLAMGGGSIRVTAH